MGKDLNTFAKLLQGGEYTIKRLTAETGAARLTVKKRLAELKSEGFRLKTLAVREGARGPASKAYYIGTR